MLTWTEDYEHQLFGQLTRERTKNRENKGMGGAWSTIGRVRDQRPVYKLEEIKEGLGICYVSFSGVHSPS